MNSDPSGASLIVDGKPQGRTPKTLTLSPGPHKITVKKPGYREWTRELLVLDGNRLKLKAELERAEQ